MKTMRIFFSLALTAVLAGSLTGCMPGITVTSPKDEAFQKDWADSMEEIAEDWAQDWEDEAERAAKAWSTQDENGVEKDHYWKILDRNRHGRGAGQDPGRSPQRRRRLGRPDG